MDNNKLSILEQYKKLKDKLESTYIPEEEKTSILEDFKSKNPSVREHEATQSSLFGANNDDESLNLALKDRQFEIDQLRKLNPAKEVIDLPIQKKATPPIPIKTSAPSLAKSNSQSFSDLVKIEPRFKEQLPLPSSERSLSSEDEEVSLPPPNSMSLMADALRNRDKQLLIGRLGKASQQLAQAASSNKTPLTSDAEIQAEAESGVNTVEKMAKFEKEQQEFQSEQELNDPKSDISSFMRDLYKSKLKVNIPDKTSAAQLKNLDLKFPSLSSSGRVVRGEGETGPEWFNVNSDGTLTTTNVPAPFADSIRVDPETKQLINVKSGTASVVEIPKNEKIQETDPTKVEVSYTGDKQKLTEYQKRLQSDPLFKEKKRSLAEAEYALKLTEMSKKNKQAYSALGASTALMYESGRLTDDDVRRYIRDQSIAGKVIQALKTATLGTFAKESAKNLNEVNNLLRAHGNKVLKDVSSEHAENFRQISSQKFSPEQARYLLNPELYKKFNPPKKQTFINMQKPDGKVVAVPLSKVEEAEKNYDWKKL